MQVDRNLLVRVSLRLFLSVRLLSELHPACNRSPGIDPRQAPDVAM